LPQETAGRRELAAGAATTVSAEPRGAPLADSRRRETPFTLGSKGRKASTVVQTITGRPAVSTQASGRSPLTRPVLTLTCVPAGAPAALKRRASTWGVVPGKLTPDGRTPEGSRLIHTTMNPPSLIGATTGLKSNGTMGAAGSSTFT